VNFFEISPPPSAVALRPPVAAAPPPFFSPLSPRPGRGSGRPRPAGRPSINRPINRRSN